MARLETRPNVQPRHNFQYDLCNYIRQKKQESYSIILGGDFNESMDQPRSAMRELAVTCGLVDIWARRNPDIEFNTRHPRSKRIDYVLVTPDIHPSVTAVGYFPFKYRGNSHHRSIYVDFDTATLFENKTSRLANLQKRGLVSTDPFSCTTYIRAARKHANENNLFALSIQLGYLPKPDHAFAEKVAEHDMHDKVLPDNIHDCRRTITIITAEIKQLEIYSASQRSDKQVQRAAIYDSTGRKDDATLLREIRHSEQMTETYRLFNYIRKEKDTSGLTKIEVPHDWPDLTPRLQRSKT
jgi:hypothetical protein